MSIRGLLAGQVFLVFKETCRRRCSPDAIRKSKELLKSLTGEKAEDFFGITTNILASSWESEEGKQGIKAFFEKKPAPWLKKGESNGQ